MKNEKTIKLIAGSIVFIMVVVFAYLLALNGRYMRIGNTGVYDKWRKEVYKAGSEEIPAIINNKRQP